MATQIFFFHPKPWGRFPILTSIFFKWVGTNHQLDNLVINGVYWGYSPLILTFDPNFLGHPSTHDLLDGIANYINIYNIYITYPILGFLAHGTDATGEECDLRLLQAPSLGKARAGEENQKNCDYDFLLDQAFTYYLGKNSKNFPTDPWSIPKRPPTKSL